MHVQYYHYMYNVQCTCTTSVHNYVYMHVYICGEILMFGKMFTMQPLQQ